MLRPTAKGSTLKTTGLYAKYGKYFIYKTWCHSSIKEDKCDIIISNCFTHLRIVLIKNLMNYLLKICPQTG